MRSIVLLIALTVSTGAAPVSISGIYPSLAMFNEEGECGTGAVVPWRDRLWVITYAPHSPKGSTDKLYEITPGLEQIIRPESIGGTPANRMIHDESNQLFIGPYVIDAERNVRAIPYSKMFGRLTGNARDLTDPKGKIAYATMEEGIYQVDVKTLESIELWADEQMETTRRKADLPGYHGKGFFSGQGVYVYANNGDHSQAALTHPETESGVLAEWDGKAGQWTVIRRNQFTEVTGPGGIHGNPHSATDPIWACGWDYKSLIMGVRLPNAGWSFYRLPKGSHSYDGAHGWNTEWPRIRDVGENELLMTMHGTFWKFPKDFGSGTTAGITPVSNYLKVIGDFCRWNDRIVFGCDDTAKNEFLNKRLAKGTIAAPQSQSNLWFVKPADLAGLGPVIGRGAVWDREELTAGAVSDPFLFSGYDLRALHLSHHGSKMVTMQPEVSNGDGRWSALKPIEMSAAGDTFVPFDPATTGVWIRLRCVTGGTSVSAVFTYRNHDSRSQSADPIFQGLAEPGSHVSGGLVRARDKNVKTLSFAAVDAAGKEAGYYELDGDLKLRRSDNKATEDFTRQNTAIPPHILQRDTASVIYTDEDGKRWRFPPGNAAYASYPLGDFRIAREVSTERDMLHIDGTFYELPARNAGGVAKARPIATHNRLIHDFCSYRGMLILTGIDLDKTTGNPHIIRSEDGEAAVWAGTIDDLWKFGKPRGEGGPWKDTPIKAGEPSDPYLMTAYDKKSMKLTSDRDCQITAQVDITGDGQWVDYRKFQVKGGESVDHAFPDSFSAYWIRFVSDADISATAGLSYR